MPPSGVKKIAPPARLYMGGFREELEFMEDDNVAWVARNAGVGATPRGESEESE